MKRFFVLAFSLFMAGSAAAQVSPSLTASRVSGVAPLMVFFDASATTGSTVSGSAFHSLEYLWTFGDSAAGTWQRGARPGLSSKDKAGGPLAGHVYERPGSYTATLTVTDGNTRATRQVKIDVADPNTVFAGAQTVCFSNGSRGFTGCPSGARQVRATDFAQAINTYKSQAKRLLFRRGETFQSASTGILDVNGPGILGSFGPVSDPLPKLQSTAETNTLQLSNYRTPNIADWRVMDLELVGAGRQNSNGIGMSGGINQATVLRITFRKQRIALVAEALGLDALNKQGVGHKIWDQLALVDNTVTDSNRASAGGGMGYGTYLSGDRVFYAGNAIDLVSTAASDTTHIARFPYLGKAVITNNSFLRAGPGAHNIKMHAPTWGDTSTVKTKGIGQGYTRWVVVSDNRFLGAYNPWTVAVGPQNAQYNEHVKDVIFERNLFVSGPGTQVSLILWATDITVRNNIFDSSGGSGLQTGVQVSRRGAEPAASGVRIYNNTFYSSKSLSSSQFVPVWLDAPVTAITARNNAAYAPNATNPVMFRNSCGGCLTQSNNSTPAQVKSSSPFVSTSPTTTAQFAAGGYAVGSGTATSTWTDFFLTAANRHDLGAVASGKTGTASTGMAVPASTGGTETLAPATSSDGTSGAGTTGTDGSTGSGTSDTGATGAGTTGSGTTGSGNATGSGSSDGATSTGTDSTTAGSSTSHRRSRRRQQ